MSTAQFRLFRELHTFFRFGVIGILATTVHGATAAGLITYASFHAIAANSVAFLMAFLCSFVGHYRWTFESGARKSLALVRFFAVASAALVANNIVLIVLLQHSFLNDVMAVLLSIMVIPIITFIAGRLWAFKAQ